MTALRFVAATANPSKPAAHALVAVALGGERGGAGGGRRCEAASKCGACIERPLCDSGRVTLGERRGPEKVGACAGWRKQYDAADSCRSRDVRSTIRQLCRAGVCWQYGEGRQTLSLHDRRSVRTCRMYRRLALRYHPDKATPSQRDAHARLFDDISRAHTILTDPLERRIYDKLGEDGVQRWRE